MDRDENEVEDVEEDDVPINWKPSMVLIAIDCHPSMFITHTDDEGNETHPFKDALTACYEVADSLIVANSKSFNQFGVVLATEESKATLTEIQGDFLQSLKILKEKQEMSAEDLQKEYERKDDLDLAGFLLLCKKKFKNVNTSYYKRNLVFITTDDNPVQSDAQKKFTALNEAKTLEPCDITLDLVPMNPDFDFTLFYNEMFHLIYADAPKKEHIYPDKDSLVEKLNSAIACRHNKIRYNFYPFKGDSSRSLKVMKVSYIRKAKLFCTAKASHDGRMLVQCKAPSEVPEPETFILEDGSFPNDFLFDLKDKCDTQGDDLEFGFHLQYVSDRQTDIGVVITDPSILILDPKEEELGHYFEQFWQYCADKNKVLVCQKKYRHSIDLRYVELIPKFANKQKSFLIKDILASEEAAIPKDVIEPVEQVDFRPPDKQREAVRQLIEKMACDYDPKMFINASYGSLKAYVKSKLLDEPDSVSVEDPTEDTDLMDEQISSDAEKIKSLFSISEPQGTKRKAPTASTWNKRGRGK